MSAVEAIYNFEAIFPDAAKTLFDGMNVFTISDELDFTKTRPRVEIVYKHQGQVTPTRIAISDGKQRASAFRGELLFHVIAGSDAESKTIHSAYRAQVRNILATLGDSLNGSALTRHRINMVTPGQEEHGIRSNDGYEQTTFPFTIDFSVQADAWADLTTTT